MDYEKKYNKLVDAIKVLQETNPSDEGIQSWVNDNVPELRKSDDDERIRKKFIKLVKMSNEVGGFALHKWEADEMLAWLEKQGNPVDKLEPKFHEGEWVVFNNRHGSVYQVEKIENYEYTLRHFLGGSMPLSFSHEDMIRAWTIQDAKDGDMLSYVTDEEDLWIMIYWSLYEPYEGHVHYHALLVNNNFSDKGTCCICIDNLKPATKEQRDTLMKAMTEAGYTFDFEKKELKKIHVIDEGKSEMDYCFTKMMNGEKVSPSWSEEDEKMCQETIDWFEKKCFPYALESENPARESIKWLKSLKQRHTWKPSDVQMQVLKEACDKRWEPDGLDSLYTLYEQLEKLKGE